MASHYDHGTVYTHYFISLADDPVPIECKTSQSQGKAAGLVTIGTLNLFATTEQLRELHQAIGAWLDADSERLAEVAGTTDTPVPVAPIPAGWDSVDTSTT